MGKKLTESETYALCRNRHEQKHLRDKLNNLSEEEFNSVDSLQIEIDKWRRFRRDNGKTSGWSAQAMRPGKRESTFLSTTSSPHRHLMASLGNDLTNAPWAYTFKGDSYNRIYREMLQSSINSKTALNLRHQSAKAVSKVSTSSGTGSSGMDGPRDSSNDEKHLPPTRLKSAWISSDIDLSSEDHSRLFETRNDAECSEQTNYLLSPRSDRRKVKSSLTRRSLEESLSKDSTVKIESRLGQKWPEEEISLCVVCGGQQRGRECESLEFRTDPKYRLRTKSADLSLVKTLPKVNVQKGRSVLCMCQNNPPSTIPLSQENTSSGNSRNWKYTAQRSYISSKAEVNGLKNRLRQQGPEDILETAFPLWDVPSLRDPELECEMERQKTCHSANQRTKRKGQSSAFGNRSNVHSAHSSTKVTRPVHRPQDDTVESKPRRKEARDETYNQVNVSQLCAFGNESIAKELGENQMDNNPCDMDNNVFRPPINHQLENINLSDVSVRSAIENTTDSLDGVVVSFHTRDVKQQTPRFKSPQEDSTATNNTDNMAPVNLTKGPKNVTKRHNILKKRNERKRPHNKTQHHVSTPEASVFVNFAKFVKTKTREFRSQRGSANDASSKNSSLSTARVSHEKERSLKSSQKHDEKGSLIDIDIKIPKAEIQEIVCANSCDSVQTLIGAQTEKEAKLNHQIEIKKKSNQLAVNDSNFSAEPANQKYHKTVMNEDLNKGQNNTKGPLDIISGQPTVKTAQDIINAGSINAVDDQAGNEATAEDVTDKDDKRPLSNDKSEPGAHSRTKNGGVYHRGVLLSNYVSPEKRYKLTTRRPGWIHRSSAQIHSTAGVPAVCSPYSSCLVRLQFSKQARQQALTKLIENNAKGGRRDSIQKALTESLQAKIKEFCISLDTLRQFP